MLGSDSKGVPYRASYFNRTSRLPWSETTRCAESAQSLSCLNIVMAHSSVLVAMFPVTVAVATIFLLRRYGRVMSSAEIPQRTGRGSRIGEASIADLINGLEANQYTSEDLVKVELSFVVSAVDCSGYSTLITTLDILGSNRGGERGSPRD